MSNKATDTNTSNKGSNTMEAYKLFKLRRDGSIGPLFINASQRVPIGEWVEAGDHPTKGFAHRPGWHCTFEPDAPHLAMETKGGPRRVWALVEVEGTTVYDRPESQGGQWVLAERLRVVRLLPDHNHKEVA